MLQFLHREPKTTPRVLTIPRAPQVRRHVFSTIAKIRHLPPLERAQLAARWLRDEGEVSLKPTWDLARYIFRVHANQTVCRDWRELPFGEVWVGDSEYYPGPGLANGGRDGDAPTPLCVVAIEMRSGRVVRQWQDELLHCCEPGDVRSAETRGREARSADGAGTPRGRTPVSAALTD